MVKLAPSEFTIRDNDGTASVGHIAQHITEVAAPNFGWDEPSALLKTLAHEKQLRNPSTIGMKLAITGREFLENEPFPPHASGAPDTSKTNMETNSDV